MMLQRLLCLVRGGHKWQTTSDDAGSVTRCVRCGTLKHASGAVSAGGGVPPSVPPEGG